MSFVFWLGLVSDDFSSFRGKEIGNEKLVAILDLQQISYKNIDVRGLITGFQFLQVSGPTVVSSTLQAIETKPETICQITMLWTECSCCLQILRDRGNEQLNFPMHLSYDDSCIDILFHIWKKQNISLVKVRRGFNKK